MKQLLKKIVKSKAAHSIACWVAQAYIRLVYYTSSWDVQGSEHINKLRDTGQAYIIAFWHGRLLMIPPFPPKNKTINVLISNHNDGELIAKTMEYFNFSFIRGSTNKDGVAALKNILKKIKKKEVIAITPDGPRGPRMRINGHIIKIAQMTSIPIIPMTYSTSRCRILKSWDRFIAAKPFGKGIFIYGEPFFIEKGLDSDGLEKAGIELENRLNTITYKADKIAGVEPVEPDEQNK